MKLRLSHTLLVALEHALGESPNLLNELTAALGRGLKDADGFHPITLSDELVERIGVTVTGLEKREWLQPFFGPLTAQEIKQHWRAAVESARSTAVDVGDN